MSEYAVKQAGDILQRDVEAFYRQLRELRGDGTMTTTEFAGNVVRAAAAVGFIDGLAAEDVGGLRPGVVNQLSSTVQERLVEASQVPGE